jgi:hypothetical protein
MPGRVIWAITRNTALQQFHVANAPQLIAELLCRATGVQLSSGVLCIQRQAAQLARELPIKRERAEVIARIK